MIEHTAPQGSPEWDRAHLGIITSRHVARIVTPVRLQPARNQTATHLLHELLAEWVTGEPWSDSGSTVWMERGVRLEPEAIDYYRALRDGIEVRRPGLIFRDESRTVGTSADLLTADGCPIEIKCPAAPRHVGNLLACEILPGVLSDAAPLADHQLQAQWHIWVLDAPWCDWMSYHDQIAQQVLIRIPRSDRYMQAFDDLVPQFVGQLLRGRDQLMNAGIVPAAEATPASESPYVGEGSVTADIDNGK